MVRRPRVSAKMPVRGEAQSAKKEVEDVMRDLSRVVRGRWEREVEREIKVLDITPVLDRIVSFICSRNQYSSAMMYAWKEFGEDVLISEQQPTHSRAYC